MADQASNVCCMCGDVGFPQKLFQCLRCLYRFQHSYCSNLFHEDSSTDPGDAAAVCDWCLSEEHRPHPRRHSAASTGSGEKPGKHTSGREVHSTSATRGRSAAGSSSATAKHSGRRYKLLKDVLC